MTVQNILHAFDDTSGWSPEAKLRLALAFIDEEESVEGAAALLRKRAEAETEMGGDEDAPLGARRVRRRDDGLVFVGEFVPALPGDLRGHGPLLLLGHVLPPLLHLPHHRGVLLSA